MAEPATIGIRREDKSPWEARVPLTPTDVQVLMKDGGLRFQLQESPTRRFPAAAYRDLGVPVVDDLRDCPIIIGVKEIPADLFEANKTYLFFSHTIKAQPMNMPMLRRIVELGCTLIDYERIVDERGRRLVFFGNYAGLAGMIDALWTLGQRLRHEGIKCPLADVRRAFEYDNLQHAQQAIAAIGARIRSEGLPAEVQPLVCGFAGYGNVSRGAQAIYDLLPTQEVTPEDLPDVQAAANTCYKVVFREEHLVQPTAGGVFNVEDYYAHPEKYTGTFARHLPHLSILMNCIYWEPKYPRVVTCEQLRRLYADQTQPRLRVIGDITCDVEGSIECTVRATEPGDPVYVYEPRTGQVHNGIAGDGPVILAVDILPCELPIDASTYFGESLRPFMPSLATADFGRSLEQSGLRRELQRATIVYRGELTPTYAYLAPHIG